jgi:integrase
MLTRIFLPQVIVLFLSVQKVQIMATIKFLLQSKSENAQIYIRLSVSKTVSLKKKTSFSINPKDWSEPNQRPIPSNTKKRPTGNEELGKEFDKHQKFKQNLHENLDKLESYIFQNLNKDLGSNILIDSFWLESKIIECFNRVEKKDKGLLVNHIEYIIDNANTRTKKGGEIGLDKNTIKNYNTFKRLIVEYQDSIKKQIQFLEITKPFVGKFKSWLINTKDYSTNYSGKNLEMLKAVCRDAEKEEIPTTPYSKTIEYFREQSKDRYIHTLSYVEIEQIRITDFTNEERLKEFKKENPELTKRLSLTPEKLNNARNWLLIGCAIGQRGGDLLNITRDNIRYNIDGFMYVDITQEKTGKDITISINEKEILEILENSLPAKIAEQKLNDYAKVICKLSGINEPTKGKVYNIKTNRRELGIHPKYEFITSHCFRRSFVTNKNKDWTTKTIMDVTGHSKESLVYSYINEREDKDLKADLQRIEYQNQTKDKPAKMVLLPNGTED